MLMFSDLIGVPYKKDCYDGSGFDCWSLIWWIYKEYGIALPQRLQEVWAPKNFRKQINDNIGNWQEVEFHERSNMDVLLFATSRNMATHVGMVIDPHVFIHTRLETGVVLERFRRGFFSAMIKKVYRWRK